MANGINPVAQALGGLTQYLMVENQRLDQENKEKKINLAAENIAERYKNLPPDATISDIQKLQYQLIEDAAAIGGLQENLPLITSLYQSTVATKEYEKAERRDSALAKFIQERYGVSGDFGGQIALALTEFQRAGEREVNTRDASGVATLKIFNDQLEEIGKIETDAVGFDTQWQWEKRRMDYAYGQDISKLKYKHELDMQALGVGSGTSANVPQYAGYDPYEGTRGTGGIPLYKHHKLGGTYYYDKSSGGLKPYWGPLERISTKTNITQVKDVLQTLQENKDTFQPERMGYLQTIGGLGLGFLQDITDNKLITDDEAQMTLATVEQIDAIMQTPKGQAKIKEAFEDLDPEEQAQLGQYFDKYTKSLTNQMGYEEIIKQTVPSTVYDGPGLISDTDYEKGSLALFQVFGGEVPAQVSAPILTYIANAAGVNVNSVNEQTFRNLSRREQEVVMKRLLPYLNYTE